MPKLSDPSAAQPTLKRSCAAYRPQVPWRRHWQSLAGWCAGWSFWTPNCKQLKLSLEVSLLFTSQVLKQLSFGELDPVWAWEALCRHDPVSYSHAVSQPEALPQALAGFFSSGWGAGASQAASSEVGPWAMLCCSCLQRTMEHCPRMPSNKTKGWEELCNTQIIVEKSEDIRHRHPKVTHVF